MKTDRMDDSIKGALSQFREFLKCYSLHAHRFQTFIALLLEDVLVSNGHYSSFSILCLKARFWVMMAAFC